MDRAAPTAITIAVVLLVFTLMLLSWRRRSRRDAHLTAGYPAPQDGGDAVVVAAAEAYYVATTPRDTPLERLAITGLGFRARADLSVTRGGLWLALAGENGVFIPASAIESLTPATMAIDRVVETDGLLRLGWMLNAPGTAHHPRTAARPGAVDSYFRIIDPVDRANLTDAIRSIAAGAVGPAGTGTTESEA